MFLGKLPNMSPSFPTLGIGVLRSARMASYPADIANWNTRTEAAVAPTASRP